MNEAERIQRETLERLGRMAERLPPSAPAPTVEPHEGPPPGFGNCDWLHEAAEALNRAAVVKWLQERIAHYAAEEMKCRRNGLRMGRLDAHRAVSLLLYELEALHAEAPRCS